MKLERWYQKWEMPLDLSKILIRAREAGFEPLIARAKELLGTVAGQLTDASKVRPRGSLLVDMDDYTSVWNRYAATVGIRRVKEGDWFLTANGHGAFYVALMPKDDANDFDRLETGYVGDDVGLEEFSKFRALLAENTKNGSGTWQRLRFTNKSFYELKQRLDKNLTSGRDIAPEEFAASRVLENSELRTLALRIKSAGAMLEVDAVNAMKTKNTLAHLQQLSDAGLLQKEFTIICRKTSAQINRIGAAERLSELGSLGLLCSCGAPIETERVEALLVPSELLARMLNHSFWMSVKLVEVLKENDIPVEDILLNVGDGSEEIDSLTNVDGSILMFELKDGEFSMGHAYPFLARLGMNNPDVGVIVATKMVSPEVKSNLERLKPKAEIVYIESLDHLSTTLADMLNRLRLQKLGQLLQAFKQLTEFELPVKSIVSARLAVELPEPQTLITFMSESR